MTTQDTNYSFNFSAKNLSFNNPIVMGILNITSDSFFDGGRYITEKAILVQTEKMLIEGASIIDIGACSTRPGATDVAEQVEIQRLLPVIKSLRKRFENVVLSIDTYHSKVADIALDAGADIINDISGGTLDDQMMATLVRPDKAYVLTHIQGTPLNMQKNPEYTNVVEKVKSYLQKKIVELENLGIKQVIIDPGFGFGKTLEHNFTLLKSLGQLKKGNYPLLVGLSRKSMITQVLKSKSEGALNGTSSLNTIALLNGADILRVHDVKEAMECIKLVQKYNGV